MEEMRWKCIDNEVVTAFCGWATFIRFQLCEVADICNENSAVWQSCQRVSSYVQGPRTLRSLNGLGPVYLTGCLKIRDEHRCQQAEVSIVLTLVCAENRPFLVWLVAEWEWAAKGKDSCQPQLSFGSSSCISLALPSPESYAWEKASPKAAAGWLHAEGSNRAHCTHSLIG